MERWCLIAMLACSGCAPYAQVQMDLATQARKGVALCQKSNQAYGQAIDRLHELERSRLDEAFDADVRERKSLSADWIIEHRKAYAAAIEGLGQQHQQLQQAQEVQQRNLAAIDQALGRLYWLQSIQARLFSLQEWTHDQ